MPRLTDFLAGYEPIDLVLAGAERLLTSRPGPSGDGVTEATLDVTVPAFAHPFIAAGLLLGRGWRARPSPCCFRSCCCRRCPP